MIYVKLPRVVNMAVRMSWDIPNLNNKYAVLELMLDSALALQAGVADSLLHNRNTDPQVLGCFKSPEVEATVNKFLPGLLDAMVLDGINNPYVVDYDTRGMFIDNREDFY